MKYVGVDIGGTNLKAGLADENGQLLAVQKMKVASVTDQQSLAWTIVAMTQELAKSAGVPLDDIASVGVGVPGTVEIRSGSIGYTCNLPLRNVPLRKLFHHYLSIPLYIENDANCAALAEYYVGAGRDSKRFVTITLGTGVGGGIIIDGKIYAGMRSMGAELGHTLLVLEGEHCTCGRDGCWEAFLSSALLCGILGSLAYLVPVTRMRMQGRDGYAAVALAWVALTLLGAFPYLLSDTIPSFVDALFETASGLTTTGATILDSVETMPPSILFWRSETQWMGGMGVLVLFLALTPHLGDGAYYLMKAESPGPIKSKLVPRVGGTAKILYTIYIVLTAAEAVALRIAGMSWFDAVNHAFTTMATGGFSVRNTSISSYQSDAITWVIIVFTFLAGINFSLLYAVVRGRIKDALRSEELRWYLLILAITITLICVDLHVELGQGWYESAKDAAFQATTIMSTTGYATKDFTLWPTFSRCILVLLMYVGGCAGSTAGGMKVSRLMLQVKSLRRELDHIIHPNRVSVITMDGQSVDERAVTSAHMFQVAYLLVLMAGTLVVSLDVLGFTESFVASLTCVSNVGPSLGALGPMANFAPLSWFSKLVLTLIMLMGRLELMPLLVLLSPSTWRNK